MGRDCGRGVWDGGGTGRPTSPDLLERLMPLRDVLTRLSSLTGRPARVSRRLIEPRRAPRVRRHPIAAGEGLETRVLLAATGGGDRGALEISAANGYTEGQAVTVEGSEFSSATVVEGFRIGTLTVNGSTDAAEGIQVNVNGEASSVSVNGGAASECVTIAGLVTSSVTFNGGGGDDVLEGVETGEISGSVTFNGDDGADRLSLRDSFTVGGNLGGDAGAGADTVEILGSAVIDNVSLTTGDGADTFTLSSTAPTTGNFTLDTQAGDDVVTFGTGTEIDGNQTVNLGDGADEFTSEGLTVRGNQVVDAGDSPEEGVDTVNFGEDDINGGSTVRWSGDVEIAETAARDIESLYTFEGTGDGTATADLSGGSDVAGDFSFTSAGETDLTVAGMTVTQANFTVNTGTGAGTGEDTVTISDTSVGGNFEATLGGSEETTDTFTQTGTLDVGDPETGTNGNFLLNLGGGPDSLSFETLNVNGNQEINLGTNGPGGDQIVLPGGTINGSSTVTWSGDVTITQFGARTVTGDYIFSSQASEPVHADADLGDGNVVGGNFSFTNTGQTELTVGLVVQEGNFTVNTGSGNGSGADTVTLLDGSRVEGNFNVTLGDSSDASADTLDLRGRVEIGNKNDPENGFINGNMTVNFGDGPDTYTAEEILVTGNQTLNFGDSGLPDEGEQGGDLPRFNTATLGEGEIVGSSNINWAGSIDLEEAGPRTIGSDYSFTGSQGAAAQQPDAQPGDSVSRIDLIRDNTRVDGNLSITTVNRSQVYVSANVNMGNATISTGAFDDTVLIARSRIGGNLNVSLADGNDRIQAFGSRNGGTVVTGNTNVTGGGGSDELEFGGRYFGAVNLEGGEGVDVFRVSNLVVARGNGLTVNGGADRDFLIVSDVRTADDLTLQGGGGEDFISLRDSRSRSAVRVLGQSDPDRLVARNVIARELLGVFGQGGMDELMTANLRGNPVRTRA